MTTAGVLLHPIRLRIVQALLDGDSLTTGELHDRLADVAAATLYRHIAKLSDAGVLTVASETRVRGAVERRYRLHLPSAVVGPDQARAMGPEEHRHAFSVFVAALLADLDRYLDRDDVDAARDGFGYGQAALWLTDAELAELRSEIAASVTSRMGNEPTPERVKRLLSTILMPATG